MIKKISWVIMTFSAISVALYALTLLSAPGIRPPFIQNLFTNFPSLTTVHFIGGAIAIVAGAFQLNSALRKKHLSIHRLLGRFYVAAIFFSAIAGFILAINSIGGSVTQLGFALMAIFWFAITLNAYRVIRKGDIQSHKQWMIRSYSVTLAGVTLRLYLGLSLVFGFNFIDVYPVLAWLCWVPNILITEIYLRYKMKKIIKMDEENITEPC